MTAKGAYQGNGKYQKQEFKRTLALCPRCKDYMSAVYTKTEVLEKSINKALPVKYCFKCGLVMVLDHKIPIVYQIHTTHYEAKKQIADKKMSKRGINRTEKAYLFQI